MFFILSKALLFLLSPITWILFLVLIAWRTKSKKVRKWSAYSAVGVFVVFSNTALFLTFCGWLEVPGQQMTDLPKSEVAVVLGGMFEYDNDQKRLSARRGADRIWQALNLFHSGKVDYILISGDNGYVSDKGLHEADQLKENLRMWGIPDSVLIVESKSVNTFENAKFSAEIIKKRKWQQVVLVTSGTHMRRSQACFKKQGIETIPYSTDLYAPDKFKFFWDQWFIPDFSTLVEWQKINKEIVGYVAYDWTGKI